MNYWIIKSEPSTYSWQQFVKDGKTMWDGVRNYQARNNLKLMELGDICMYYHSNEGKEIVGLATVCATHYPDPNDPKWVVVDMLPQKKLDRAVGLQQLKTDDQLQNLPLIRHSRLSVMPITEQEFDRIVFLSNA